jgi:hypothetical protein
MASLNDIDTEYVRSMSGASIENALEYLSLLPECTVSSSGQTVEYQMDMLCDEIERRG